ncbi:agmatinase [Polymorphobacter fuscus]|uniref:Agmatinase n=1 Tax=Sandarakinorhabdus fusca TaxID=1439888 RepID=A0A7C9KY27_9SPHN|nr:agmatinase [Polymorphobacter fuscus]KAB7648864.1 agmatinase [Polymorphobacter fuscus]MQT16448.1 agmatinase [Polymorphobacter fuscus]NJC07262.1 agmatinase [Polymorphobacter fuscus]
MTAVRLIGLPTDVNSSFVRGAAAAPARIRAQLFSPHSNLASEGGGEIGRDIALTDAGDLALTEGRGDAAIITAAVAAALAASAAPLLLGGDHSVTFPIVTAIAAHHGPVTILHFDAHSDLYDDFEGNPASHASPFARIMEAGMARRLVQVGIRTLNDHCRAQAARFGVEIVPMRDFTPDAVPRLDGPVYVSVDLDGLDPAFAPGVAHHEPGGLSTRQLLDVLARVDAPVVGADIVEYNPGRDINDMTAVVAAKLVKELAALLAR